MRNRSQTNWQMKTAAGVAIGFGILTILSGGTVLFGGDAAQEVVGNTVSFVLWFNFLSGFVYVLAGIGIALARRWAVWIARALTVSIAAVFALLGVYVFAGGAYEIRTVIAMALRLFVWGTIAFVAGRNTFAPTVIAD